MFLFTSIAVHALILITGVRDAYGLGSILGFSGSKLLALWPYALLFVCGVLLYALTFSRVKLTVWRFFKRLLGMTSVLGRVNWVIFFGWITLFGVYRLAGWSFPGQWEFSQVWIFGHLGLIGALILAGTRKISPPYSLLVSYSIFGLFLWVIYFLPDIQSYPLALGWSETSRYYYASLFFSPVIYGKWAPLSSLHPSRYLMQSLPFLIPGLPLWAHRLWQVLLWLGVTFAAGAALAHRIKPQNRWLWLGIASWFTLFSFQGPVYYHLMVIIIIVLLGFNKDKPWQSLGWVCLASLWAGISRINWFPVAGMLGVTLYVLEMRQEEKNFWQYWRWPVTVVLAGLALAFGAQAIYASISGNPPEVFASSFNSPLYQYRLFPNEAYGPGIINLLLTASFPLLVIILWKVFPRFFHWRFLRLMALLSILCALLAAGLIVSMKIGGGNNLHNLDSFLVFLAVIAAYIGFNRFTPDRAHPGDKFELTPPLVVLVWIIPLVFALNSLRPYPNLDQQRAWQDIRQVQALVDQVTEDGGEVLFIQHRHLLTFEMIKGVELVPEYEKVFLMEMAMSDNQMYLSQFWHDLETHRFDLIITSPVTIITQSAMDEFGEENNLWVERVGQPLVGYYESILNLPESDMAVLAPKSAP